MASFEPEYKDPSDVIDISVDWADFLGEDAIASVVWTVSPTGALAVDTQSNTDTVATAWVSGGVASVTYSLACKITSVGGRTVERSLEIIVEDL
jgi:hypothetical protein